MSMLTLVFAFAFSVVSDIGYDSSHQEDCVGDLYLPEQVLPSTPMVVIIHGGGWTGMDRDATKGIANYFAKDLGFAAFNIEYRLASEKNRWPACGNDCVAAANFVLSDDFKAKYGFAYDKVWICGGSAGGHLALWSLVSLDKSKVAGVIAISPIGDPDCDVGGSRAGQQALLGPEMDYNSMDPRRLVAAGQAPLLITHATDDAVVPISSSKSFAEAYSAVGNSVEFFEYPNDIEPNESGHCIWRPASNPHRLIDTLERKIAFFVRNAVPVTGLKSARTIDVVHVSRTSDGRASSVDLAFGPGNGLSNRLYVAYGEDYGGDRVGSWQHYQYVTTVMDEMDSYTAIVPKAEKLKFFLDVPFPDGEVSVPLKAVEGTSVQYLDTKITIRGGDVLRCRFSPSAVQDWGGIMGTRTSSDVNDRNVNVIHGGDKFWLDYTGDASIANNYDKYRLTPSCWNGSTYDITLSAAKREVRNVGTGTISGLGETECPDKFETPYTAYLFKVSGTPSTTYCGKGKMHYYEHLRNNVALAAYLPYRVGKGRIGFYDRVSGEFRESITQLAFLGEEDESISTPLTSATETIVRTKVPRDVEPKVRRVVAATWEKIGSQRKINLEFSADNGYDHRLFLAWGETDQKRDAKDWDNFESICTLTSGVSSLTIDAPDSAVCCRVFLSLPFVGDDFPVPLVALKGDGVGYFDTRLKIMGGDTVLAKVNVSKENPDWASILGSRFSATSGSDRNVVAAYNASQFYLDYTSSDISGHRCIAAFNYGTWYDLLLSPTNRSVAISKEGTLVKQNPEMCSDKFTTVANCWLFYASGSPSVTTKFKGWIASFSIRDSECYKCSWYPCRMGDKYGYYDRITSQFIEPICGSFTGEELEGESPLVSVSDVIHLRRGLLVIVR